MGLFVCFVFKVGNEHFSVKEQINKNSVLPKKEFRILILKEKLIFLVTSNDDSEISSPGAS